MESEFDVFERFPDGGVIWRAVVSGLDNVRDRLVFFGSESSHEFFAMNVLTKQVVARVNAAPGEPTADSANA